MLSEAAVRQKLTGKQQQLRDAVFVQPAKEELARARELAGMAEFHRAIEALRRAEAHLTYFREHLTSNQDYLDVERFLLQLLLGLDAYDEARAVMRRLATMAPHLALDPLHFSVQAIEQFERIKSELAYTTGLTITSEPTGAKVFLDAAPRGTTPLFLPQIPQGRHYIRLEGASGVFFRDILLDSSEPRTVHGVLGAPAFHSAPDEGGHPPDRLAILTAVYHALGTLLQVDYLVFAQLDESGIEAALFHVRTSSFTVSYKVLIEPGRPPATFLERLALELSSQVGPNGEPRQTAPLDRPPSPDTNFLLRAYFFDDLVPMALMAPGQNMVQSPRKPFYRKAWFWGAAGVAAVAGGALAWFTVTRPDNGAETVTIRFLFPLAQ